MKKLDEVLLGGLRGKPFAADPGRAFWADHPKSTWSEVLGLEQAEFIQHFEALGDKKELAANDIYLVNGCNIMGHAPGPYGRVTTDDGERAGHVKWYTYGERLPREQSVISFYKNVELTQRRAILGPRLHQYLEDCVEARSPRKRKLARRSPSPESRLPPVVLRATGGCGVVDEGGAAVARADVDRVLAAYGWRLQGPVVSYDDASDDDASDDDEDVPEGRRAAKFEAFTLDPRDLTSEAGLLEQAGLYALFKRLQIEESPGVYEVTISCAVTCTSKTLVLRTKPQSSKTTGERNQRTIDKRLVAEIIDVYGTLDAGLAALGRRSAVEFHTACQNLGLALRKRMTGKEGLAVMSELGLSYTQYKLLNSILIDNQGAPVLAPEKLVRRELDLLGALDLSVSKAKMVDVHGEEVEVTMARVDSFFAAVEKTVGELYAGNQIRKDLDYIPVDGTPDYTPSDTPSPFRHSLVLKLMGDKGGGSTKFGFVLVNAKEANSPKRFCMLCEYDGLDSYENLEAAVFEHFRPEMEALKDMKIVLFKSGPGYVAKVVPSEFPVGADGVAVTITVPKAPQPLRTPSRPAARMVGGARVRACRAPAPRDAGPAVPNVALRPPMRIFRGLDLPSATAPHRIDVEGDWTWGVHLGDGGEADGVVAVHEGDDGVERAVAWLPFWRPLDIATGAGAKLEATVFTPMVFLSSDYAFLAEVLGHQGGAAKFRCLNCQICDSQIQESTWEELENKPEARTMPGFHADAARYYTTTMNAAAAQKCHNVVALPLLSAHAWDMDYFAPLPLHMFLGPIAKNWDLLLDSVRADVEEIPAEARAKAKKLASLKDMVGGLQHDLAADEKLLKAAVSETKAIGEKIRNASRGLPVNAKEANLKAKGLDASEITDIMRLRTVYKALQANEKALDKTVKKTRTELGKYETTLRELEQLRGEPGAVELALEKFLHDIKATIAASVFGASERGARARSRTTLRPPMRGARVGLSSTLHLPPRSSAKPTSAAPSSATTSGACSAICRACGRP